jgi:alpha-galactosidase
MHISGELAKLSSKQLRWLQEGLGVYRRLRPNISTALPVLPFGLPTTDSRWLCAGLVTEARLILALWRLDTPQAEWTIPLADYAG